MVWIYTMDVSLSFTRYRRLSENIRLEKAPRDIKIKSQVKGSMRVENFTTFLILEKRSLLREITNIRLGMSAPLGLRSLNVYYTFVYYTRYCYYLCYFRTNQQSRRTSNIHSKGLASWRNLTIDFWTIIPMLPSNRHRDLFFSVGRFYPLRVIFHWNRRQRKEVEGGGTTRIGGHICFVPRRRRRKSLGGEGRIRKESG